MRRFCLVAVVSLLLPLLFCHSSFGTFIEPTIEEFKIEFGTGGIVDIAGDFTSTPGDAPGSLNFSFTGLVEDPNDHNNTAELTFDLHVDPDPEIFWFGSVFNGSMFGLRILSRVFTGTFLDAINETSVVRSIIEPSSSLTDIVGDGATIAPAGQSHLAVSELFNTTTTANMGVDIGDAFTIDPKPGGGGQSLPGQTVGWKPSPQGVLGPGEEWHGMRTYLNFSVTPLDAAVVIGRTQIQQVPEPSTLILFGVGILGMVVFYGWRKGRSQQ
jgi:hypothetical protein